MYFVHFISGELNTYEGNGRGYYTNLDGNEQKH